MSRNPVWLLSMFVVAAALPLTGCSAFDDDDDMDAPVIGGDVKDDANNDGDDLDDDADMILNERDD
jgi:hypothetical protein